MPLQIYLTESGVSLEQLADNVADSLRSHGRCIVVISEGFDVGDIGATKDAFGHAQFSASQTSVSQAVVNYLNGRKLPVRGKARGQTYGTDQRDTAVYASTVDLDEAHKVALKAVEIAAAGKNGFMATILREPGAIYGVRYDKVPLEQVANSERKFPAGWIADNRIDVTDEFVRYVRPLIGDDWVSVPLVNGLQRFARIERRFADKVCAQYVPQASR
jgi:6-phosphofructokinase 1